VKPKSDFLAFHSNFKPITVSFIISIWYLNVVNDLCIKFCDSKSNFVGYLKVMLASLQG